MSSSSQPSPRHARIAATLQGIVGRVLRIEPRDLDIEVPFLELGADSLALVEALRGLQEAFGVRLTIRQLFEQLPTISALAAFLEQTVPEPHPPAPSPIAPPAAGRGGEQYPGREEGPKARAASARGIAPGWGAGTGTGTAVSPPAPPAPPPAREGASPSPTLGLTPPRPGLEGVFGMQIQAFNQLVAQQLAMLGGRAPAQTAPLLTQETGGTKTAAPVLPTFVGKAAGRTGEDLNDRQRRHLDDLIERYCLKTAKSKELTEKYRPWLADSRATVGFRPQIKEMLYPLARARSHGSRLWDIDGNEYVDVTMGMGVHLFGHDPDFLRDTLAAQVREGFELGPRSAHSGEVAALFCELTGMERATFTNSGTEACMTAIRLARARTGRSKIVMFAGSYHGHSDGTLAQTQEVDGELRSFPVAPGIPAKVAEDVLVLDYGTPEALEIIRRHRGELAAVIVEPIQSRRPEVQPREFLHALRALTAENGIALVFDEMICGFRLHLGGAQAWFGVRADLATYGKIIGGGLPIGVVAGSADYMDGIDGGLWRYGDDSHPERDTTFFGGTFCQHPLAMAAARRVLTYLKEQGPGLQERLNDRTARFAGRLNDWFKAEGVPIRMQYAHSLFRFAFSTNAELLYYHLVEKGVYVWEWRNCFLSTAHTDADLDFIVGAVQESVAELRRGGFLPEKPSGSGGGTGEPAKGFWDRQAKPAIAPTASVSAIPAALSIPRGVDFSLYFFGNYAAEFQAGKYDLLLDCARFADRNGFSGLWFPERHFHPFGGISPNPSVLAAALARETERIALRAGSVVLPLHHPLRVAEEWALVDNLSGGRVGLSYASGWHPNDFALAPEAYGKHRELMIERAAIVEKLWRGEALRVKDGAGTEVDLRIYPLPARRDLPVWITIVNNPETYRLAGEMGAGVLTNLMGQTVEGLAANLALYREALAAAGHLPDAGHVTLLLHTFLGSDAGAGADTAIDTARRPFYSYMESSVGLLKNMLASEGTPIDWDNLSRDDLDYMLELAYQRYVKTSALIGSPETVAPIVERLRAVGVDEIACLIDFGVAPDPVRASLPWMAALKDRFLPHRPEPVPEAEPVEFPLTEAQTDLWTVAQLGAEASLAYLEAAILEMRGPLDLPLLRRALQSVIDRHEALRSVILPPAPDQRPLQQVLLTLDLMIPLVDATGCPPDRREEVSRQWLESESGRRFDLARGPLVRFTVLRLDARCHRLGAFVHHIMADGLSIVLFMREALDVYEAGRAGRRAVLPEPMQFRDYAAWLERGGDESAADEAYWLQSFAGTVPVFDPPTDHPRPAVRGFRGARQRLVMDSALYHALHQAGRRQGATLFISLLALWTALLHRWTGQDDLVVGGPTARRPLEGGDRLVGHCVDLVPYRSRLGANAEETPFLSYLAAVRTTVLDAHDHGAWPLARLLRALQLPHDPSRAPLISAVFNLDPGPGVVKAAGLELAERSPAITHAKFDIALHVLEAGGELVLYLDHRRDLFDAATMDRQLAQFVTLSAGIVADPSRPLADLPLLTAAEQQQLLEDWNRTSADYPKDSAVHDLVAAVATRDPQAPAIVWTETDREAVMTYGELAERAGHLADQLRKHGVGPGAPVVLNLERSPDLVVAMLAVLQAGGAYVPVDPSDPEERRAFLLADSGARVRVGPGLEVAGGGAPLPAEGGAMGEGSGVRSSADALAYIIYTSGSTGHPKGVAVPHRAIVRLVRNTDYIHLGPGDRVAHLSNTAFDAATFEVWGALLNGAALVVIPREVVLSPRSFAAELRRHRISAMFITTALFNEVSREEPAALGAMRTLLVGGEAAAPDRMREVLAVAAPGARLANIYGPTEGTTFSTWQPLDSVPAGRAVPIGRPVANTRVWVLDRGLRPVPLGAPGELCIGGDGLARGYWNRPDLTAERFVPNPFEDGGPLYRTGDRVRRRADGAIEFLGRTDGQVKIRGFRVETGEVESVLARCPGVRKAVVVAQEGEERRLVAFVVPTSLPPLPGGGGVMGEGGRGGEGLRVFLHERLPEAMIPAAFVFLDALPLTPSGKVDRRALAQTAAVVAEPERATTAPRTPPRTPMEEIIAAVWANVLHLETIGVEDDFFALGGHSLLAGRVLSRLRAALGVELSLRDFFQAPTVAGLAARVTAARRAGTRRAVPPLLPVPLRRREAGVPLSLAQERLWLVEKLEPGTPIHGIPLVHRISGPLRPDLLTAALARLVERQEALRTVFLEIDGTPVQKVVSAAEAAALLPLVDLSGLGGLPEALGRSAEERLAAAVSLLPFDLTAGPLRALLIRRAAGEHTLFLNVHHIAADEWSLDVMARELSALYAAGAAARPAVLPPLPVQSADFAVWQRGWLCGATLDESLAWWRAHLSGAPAVLDLPSDRAPGAARSFRGKVERMTVPGRAAAVRRLAREQGATFFLTLFAVFEALLHRLTGATDLLAGIPVAGRDRTELEDLVGFFVNTLVLRTDLSGHPAFAELLARVREEALDTYLHQDLPFAKLVEGLTLQRSAARNPLVQVLFSVPDLSSARLALGPDLHDAIQASTTLTSKFDLSLFVGDVDGALEIEAEFTTDLFDPATVRGLMTRYALLLESCLADPETPVESLVWMTAAEQERLLAESSSPAVPGAPETVHEMVAAWAAREPERTALVSDEGRMTYGELVEHAEALARRLIAHGVEPDACVGVFLERSPALIVALLAVLQAGAAYVPLDPEEASERLERILEDAEATVVLTDRFLADTLPGGAVVPVLAIDAIDAIAEPSEADVAEALPRVFADSLAYVIFTSGSTGRPKGVAVPHGGVVRLVHEPGFAELTGEAFLQASAVTFDLSTLEIWGPLANGGQIVLPRAGRLSAWEIVSAIERFEATSVWITAALFLQVLEESDGSSLRSLRQLMAGGDVVPAAAVRRCLEMAPGLRVIHGYGPTENTTFTTTWTLTDPAAVRSPLPLGTPIHGTDLFVVDSNLRLSPPGVPGELVTGGRGLARGYHGRPDLTAERFVPHPFSGTSGTSAAPGERLYRTGDLVRFGADGILEFLGRRDAQVKVRGVRIELAEIESALAACPGVREGAVVVRRRGGGDESLVAFFVPRSSPSPDPAALRSALLASLPPAMLPSVFFEVPALPLTASGKLDRRELEQAAEVDASMTLAEASPDPSTPLEEVLAGIWAAILRVERVGVHDDFFLLGGHSLLAAVILSRVREALGVELTLRVFFSAPTVARFAVRIEEALQEKRPEPRPPITRAPRDGRLPLSFAQERLWLIDQLQPGSTAYNSFLPARLTGPLHEAALEAALAAVVRRHETLRTHFASGPDGPVQAVTPFTSWRLPVADLGGLPEEARSAELRRLIVAETRRPFDFAHGPLFRACLIRLAEGDQALLLNLHHSICDGWSLETVMTAEMSALYRAALTGTPASLPPLPVQYADFAQWQRAWLQGAVLDAEIAWWKEHLGAEPPVLDLPADHLRPPVPSGRGAVTGIVLPPEIVQPLAALGRQRGVTLFMTLLAVLQTVLHRWSGQERISIGTPVATRGRVELEGLIGFFINTLVLCGDLSGNPSGAALLDRARDLTLGAFEHQDLPFEKLVAAVQTRRDPSRNPLFQVLFVLQNNRSSALDLPGINLSLLSQGGASAALFDLSFSAVELDGLISLTAAYSQDLFERPTIDLLLDHVRRIAAAFAEDPQRAVGDIALPAIPERRQVTLETAAEPAQAPAPASGSEIRHRREQLASRRKQLSPERQALLRKWVGGGAETAPQAAEPPKVSPLVAIRPISEDAGNNGRTPLFLVHPASGNVNSYLDLAKHLDPAQPLYGLQAPGLTGGAILEGMDTIASRYLEALRTVQPHGPYRLGGWCVGGTFAYEMARRLRAAGEEVEILLLIDSHGPTETPIEPNEEAALLAFLANDFGAQAGQRLTVPVDELRRIPAAERLDWILTQAQSSGVLPASFAPEQAHRYWEVFRANIRAIESYVPPEPLPVPTVLFRAAIQPTAAQDRPALGWAPWIAGPLEVIPLEGDHYEVVSEPLVRNLAHEVAGRLAVEALAISANPK